MTGIEQQEVIWLLNSTVSQLFTPTSFKPSNFSLENLFLSKHFIILNHSFVLDPDECIHHILSDAYCKVNAVITFLLNLQAEWIAVLVALDRVIAVFFGVLYKQKGTMIFTSFNQKLCTPRLPSLDKTLKVTKEACLRLIR